MAAATGGFGIAGHKNSYTRGVKVENWNEDAFGEDLVAKRGGVGAVAGFSATSEARSMFMAPAKMDDKQVRSFPIDPPGTYVASRDGMPARLLFAHGPDVADPDAGKADIYASMYVLLPAVLILFIFYYIRLVLSRLHSLPPIMHALCTLLLCDESMCTCQHEFQYRQYGYNYVSSHVRVCMRSKAWFAARKSLGLCFLEGVTRARQRQSFSCPLLSQ
jgi:hypothetical protein